jgi:tellurite methyltransferase
MNEQEWNEYFDAAMGQPVHFLFETAAQWFPEEGTALDLGCGVGSGSLFMTERGLTVTAVDASPRALEIVAERAPGVERVLSTIEAFEFPIEEFEVIAATFSLFFVEPVGLAGAWEGIRGALKPGGLFLGQFLGPKDDWKERGYPTQTQDELKEMFEGFEIRFWDHVERDGRTVQGNLKHWDITHVAASKVS